MNPFWEVIDWCEENRPDLFRQLRRLNGDPARFYDVMNAEFPLLVYSSEDVVRGCAKYMKALLERHASASDEQVALWDAGTAVRRARSAAWAHANRYL